MKANNPFSIIISSLLFFFIFLTTSLPANTSPAPKGFVSDTGYDFGVVHEGEKVRHPFIIKNNGSAPLVIIDVKTD